MIRRTILVAALALLGTTQDLSRQAPLIFESTAVMVEDDVACRGAGIRIGPTTVITANHVVRDLDVFRVRIKHLRKSIDRGTITASDTVYPYRVTHRSERLDLAVLQEDSRIVRPAAEEDPFFDYLGDDQPLEKGGAVYAIGCGDGRRWDAPAAHDQLLGPPEGDDLFFQSTYVRQGFSGGPLILAGKERPSHIIGMVQSEQPRVRALRWSAIARQLSEWNVRHFATYAGLTPGCSYEVGPAKLLLPLRKAAEGSLAVITGESCEWGITGLPRWVSARVPGQENRAWFRGSAGIVLTTTSENKECGHRATIAVARKPVEIEQFGMYGGSSTCRD